MSPKMNKNLVKLLPLDYKKATDSDDSFECLSPEKSPRRVSSTTSDSQASSEENTPQGKHSDKKMSIFSKRKIIDADTNGKLMKYTAYAEKPEKPAPQVEKSEESCLTPKIARKKGNLYKLTIIQNASKSSFEKTQPHTTTNVKSEEFKEDLDSKFSKALLKDKEEAKSAGLKHSGSFQHLAVEEKEKVKVDSTIALKNLVFGPKVDEKILKKHLLLIIRGLNYSLKLLKAPPMTYIQSRQIMLKELKKKNTKTLLMDLDETLITSCSLRDEPEKILTPSEGGPPIMIKIRPFAKEFLKKMKEHFEIIVFTAAVASYAETIVKELDPEKKFISYILDRNFCLETKNGFYIKDLRIVKNRDLKNMMLVDNLVHSFGFQVENGIPIIEWTGNKHDTELKHLMEYLLEARKHDDVRDYNRAKLRLVELGHSNLEEIIDL
jgi:Dullard-like phosphatase family protein